MEEVAPTVWQASHTPLPLGDRLAAVRWLNRRIAPTQLRHWLDSHAGARTLHVSPQDAYLVGWLGEDLVAQVRSDDSQRLVA
jgi:hypothetical protein